MCLRSSFTPKPNARRSLSESTCSLVPGGAQRLEEESIGRLQDLGNFRAVPPCGNGHRVFEQACPVVCGLMAHGGREASPSRVSSCKYGSSQGLVSGHFLKIRPLAAPRQTLEEWKVSQGHVSSALPPRSVPVPFPYLPASTWAS